MARRYRVLFFLLFLSATSLAPLIAFGATSTAFPGSIIPPECNCPSKGSIAGGGLQTGYASWGCVIKVVQNLVSFGVYIGIIIAVLIIAYAGFLWVINPVSPENRSKARQILINAAIGLVLTLAAWLLVNTILNVLGAGTIASRTSILTVKVSEEDTNGCAFGRADTGNTVPTPGGGGVTGSPTVGRAGALCADGNTACSTTALKAAGLSDAQASAMSCIAVTESSGNPNTPDSNTGACGTFQITNRPGNWHNPDLHQGSCTVNTSCNNAACNMQTAVIMLHKYGYQPWTGKKPDGQYWNPNAVACVAKYDPGH